MAQPGYGIYRGPSTYNYTSNIRGLGGGNRSSGGGNRSSGGVSNSASLSSSSVYNPPSYSTPTSVTNFTPKTPSTFNRTGPSVNTTSLSRGAFDTGRSQYNTGINRANAASLTSALNLSNAASSLRNAYTSANRGSGVNQSSFNIPTGSALQTQSLLNSYRTPSQTPVYNPPNTGGGLLPNPSIRSNTTYTQPKPKNTGLRQSIKSLKDKYNTVAKPLSAAQSLYNMQQSLPRTAFGPGGSAQNTSLSLLQPGLQLETTKALLNSKSNATPFSQLNSPANTLATNPYAQTSDALERFTDPDYTTPLESAILTVTPKSWNPSIERGFNTAQKALRNPLSTYLQRRRKQDTGLPSRFNPKNPNIPPYEEAARMQDNNLVNQKLNQQMSPIRQNAINQTNNYNQVKQQFDSFNSSYNNDRIEYQNLYNQLKQKFPTASNRQIDSEIRTQTDNRLSAVGLKQQFDTKNKLKRDGDAIRQNMIDSGVLVQNKQGQLAYNDAVRSKNRQNIRKQMLLNSVAPGGGPLETASNVIKLFDPNNQYSPFLETGQRVLNARQGFNNAMRDNEARGESKNYLDAGAEMVGHNLATGINAAVPDLRFRQAVNLLPLDPSTVTAFTTPGGVLTNTGKVALTPVKEAFRRVTDAPRLPPGTMEGKGAGNLWDRMTRGLPSLFNTPGNRGSGIYLTPETRMQQEAQRIDPNNLRHKDLTEAKNALLRTREQTDAVTPMRQDMEGFDAQGNIPGGYYDNQGRLRSVNDMGWQDRAKYDALSGLDILKAREEGRGIPDVGTRQQRMRESQPTIDRFEGLTRGQILEAMNQRRQQVQAGRRNDPRVQAQLNEISRVQAAKDAGMFDPNTYQPRELTNSEYKQMLRDSGMTGTIPQQILEGTSFDPMQRRADQLMEAKKRSGNTTPAALTRPTVNQNQTLPGGIPMPQGMRPVGNIQVLSSQARPTVGRRRR